jgi:two-component system, response regulator RegA
MTDATSTPSRTLLVVDDDATFRGRLVRAFGARGFEVSGAGTYEDALAIAEQEPPELAVVDLRLPTRSGIDVIRGLKEIEPSTVAIVLTGYGSIATAVEAMKSGALTYLTKPVDADQILAAFESSGLPDTPIGVPSLARVEWEHLQRVLTECHGNLSQAARLLGIHRRSLQRKLSKNPTPDVHRP